VLYTLNISSLNETSSKMDHIIGFYVFCFGLVWFGLVFCLVVVGLGGWCFLVVVVVCVCVFVLCSCLQTNQKRASDSNTGGCESLCGCWALNSGPLKEQSVLSSTEPSFQPL